MKNFQLSVVFMLFILGTLQAQQATIHGKASVCPDETTTYDVTMNVNTFKRCYFVVTDGIILQNGTNTITLSSVGGYFNSTDKPSITVKWNNNRGAMGKVRVIGYYDIIFVEAGDSDEMDVLLGSPVIGQFTIASPASCAQNVSAFTVAPVPGATSYQWSNSLGWTTSSVGTTASFTSTTPTTSGTVSVTAKNSNCPTTNSSRTLSVTRAPSTPFISGPEVIQPNYNGDFLTNKGSNFLWTQPVGWVNMGAQGNYYMQVQAPSYSSSGYLTVTYNDACGVSGSASKFISTELYEESFVGPQEKDFRIYPNPASAEFFIESGNDTGFKVSIANEKGEVVLTPAYSKKDKGIDIRELKEGSYIVSIAQGRKLYTRRLVVKKK